MGRGGVPRERSPAVRFETPSAPDARCPISSGLGPGSRPRSEEISSIARGDDKKRVPIAPSMLPSRVARVAVPNVVPAGGIGLDRALARSGSLFGASVNRVGSRGHRCPQDCSAHRGMVSLTENTEGTEHTEERSEGTGPVDGHRRSGSVPTASRLFGTETRADGTPSGGMATGSGSSRLPPRSPCPPCGKRSRAARPLGLGSPTRIPEVPAFRSRGRASPARRRAITAPRLHAPARARAPRGSAPSPRAHGRAPRPRRRT